MEGKKTNPISHAFFYRRLKLRYFFDLSKLRDAVGHTRRISYAEKTIWSTTTHASPSIPQGNETFHGGVVKNRMVGALRLGILKKQPTRAKMSRLKIRFRGSIGIKMAYFYSSRIFDEDGLARIEIGSGRRSDEGIAPHKSKKRPSFSGGTPAFRLLARLTKA